MAINIFEIPIQPKIDLDTDVIVYVPGYAIKGPEMPTLTNQNTFTEIFGNSAYKFKTEQVAGINGNNRLVGQYEKSWLYAKALTDAGLTVLYHRYPSNLVADCSTVFTLKNKSDVTVTEATFNVKAKYSGSYYNGIEVKFTQLHEDVVRVSIKDSEGISLEERVVSFNPSNSNYINDTQFSNIVFYTGEGTLGLDALALESKYGTLGDYYYCDGTGTLAIPASEDDEFSIGEFEDNLESTDSIFNELEDTNKYASVTYITTGGYFQNSGIAKKLLSLAAEIKALSPIDLPDSLTSDADLTAFKDNLSLIAPDSLLDFSFGYADVGANTYKPNGIKTVLPDSFGGLMALAGNIKAGLPPWLPIANNSQGAISSAISTTRPISRALQTLMISDTGISINPIVDKQNVGFVLMGNRTLYPNTDGLGPQSFKNCRYVVNSVERAARRVADSLQIASTNPTNTFRKFVAGVEPTIKKMLVNGDGLNAYNIRKLPKTKPATTDVEIKLVVVEGIETFNIYIPYSLNMQG